MRARPVADTCVLMGSTQEAFVETTKAWLLIAIVLRQHDQNKTLLVRTPEKGLVIEVERICKAYDAI